MKRAVAWLWRNAGFVSAALVLTYCLVHVFDPPRLNWGDSSSDYNAMNAGRNFATYGFLKLRLTPFLLDPAVMGAGDSVFVYTHYPQLPDLMNGVLRTVFGLSELTQFRVVALGFSFAGLLFAYALMRRYWGRGTAQIGLAFWVVNPLWIQHADYLHHSPYGAFFGFGSVYFLTRFLDGDDDGRRHHGYFIASGIFLFFVFLASYDYWFFAPLLLALVVAHHYGGAQLRPAGALLAILACFAVAAMAFKFGTNAWALGGIDHFLRDFRFQFMERATDKVTRSSFAGGIWPTIEGRTERFFTLLLFPVTAVWVLAPFAPVRWRERLSLSSVRRSPNPAWLLIAALPFFLIFKEIWVAQYYPTLLVLPFYAVACGALVALTDASLRPLTRFAGIVAALLLLWNSVDEGLRFQKAFLPEPVITQLRHDLDSVSKPGQQILVDHVFDAAYRYYFDRNTIAMILNPPGVAELALASYADPVTHPRSGTAEGAIFVQHKHVRDELFDKGYYYLLGRYGLWAAWGNPEQYRAVIDTIVTERDSVLMAKVAQNGKKLFETNFYVVWRVKPPTMP